MWYFMCYILERFAYGFDLYFHFTLYREIYISRLTYVKIQSNLAIHDKHARMK